MRFILVLTAFAFLAQAALFDKKRFSPKNDVLRPKDDLVMDMQLYIDYSEYAKWLVFKGGNEAEAVKEMTNFYNYVVKEVNEIYQRVNRPGFTLSLSLAQFVINKKFSIFADLSENYTMGEPLGIDAFKALDIAHEFYVKNSKLNPKKIDPAVYVVHISETNVLGITELGVACSYRPVIVLKSQGSNELILTLTHEIAHTLGADHDDTYENGCNGKDMYIMAPTPYHREHHLVKNSFLFSKCSLDDIETFINDLNKNGTNCLRKTKTHFLPADVKAPGEMYSLDQQCQLNYGPQSYHCGGGSVCKVLMCFIPDKKTCLSEFRETAADGTPCANRNWCQLSECVYDPQAPTFNQTSDAENCHLGDYKGNADGTFNGEQEALCEKVEKVPPMCYEAFNRDNCCETCHNLKSNSDSCEFGDKHDWCEGTVRSHPGFCKLKSSFTDCCHTCSIYYKEQDIGAYEAVKTDTCSDHFFFCFDFETASMCYKEKDDCCGSCSIVENAQNKGCEYGDKKEDCTEDMCATEADQCCHTCKKDQ